MILCERGIRTFETATRFTLDLSAMPWLKLHSHLPVIVDPSHASGDRRLVEPLARAAAAVGADGIIVEVHEDPEAALCDGPQALYARDFKGFAERVAAHAALDGPRARADAAADEVRADERGDGQRRAGELARRPGGSPGRSAIANVTTGTRLMNSEPLAGPSRLTPSFQASTAITAAGPAM